MPVTSVNMGMTIPTYKDPSPDYVTNFYNALQTLDAHDHTSGNGLPVPVAGLNINADLDWLQTNPNDARSYGMFNNTATLTNPSDVTEINVVNGDLYYNNASGQPVQITSGGGLNFTGTGGFGGDYVSAGAAANYDDTNKVYDFYQSGGTTFCDIHGGAYTASTAAPFFEWNPSSGTNYRSGAASDDMLWWTADIALSGSVDGNDRYTQVTPGFVLHADATEGMLVGVNIDPAALLSGSTKAALAVNGTGDTSSFTMLIQALAGNALAMIAGDGALCSGNLAASWEWYDYGNADSWSLGLLSTVGAGSTGGVAGDFQLYCGGTANVIAVNHGTQYVGFGKPVPADRVDINGDIRATGGFRMALHTASLTWSSLGTGGTQCLMSADGGAGSVVDYAWTFIPPYAGSLVGIGAVSASAYSGNVVVELFYDGTNFATLTFGGGASGGHVAFAKDTYPFAAGVAMTCYVKSSSGTVTTNDIRIFPIVEA